MILHLLSASEALAPEIYDWKLVSNRGANHKLAYKKKKSVSKASQECPSENTAIGDEGAVQFSR